MSIDPYDEILNQAKEELSPEQQERLVIELAQHVARKYGEAKHNIMELQGLGKQIWKDIDADEYVAKERDSWDE